MNSKAQGSPDSTKCSTTMGSSKTRARAKGKSSVPSDVDTISLPPNHKSHSTSAKFPFMLGFAMVDDVSNHWDSWKDLRDKALANATSPSEIKPPPQPSDSVSLSSASKTP